MQQMALSRSLVPGFLKGGCQERLNLRLTLSKNPVGKDCRASP